MTWQTIMVCEPCFDKRKDTDDQLVDRPCQMLGYTESCYDCGKPGAAIPIRANINPQQPTTEE